MVEQKDRLAFLIDTSVLVNIRDVHQDSADIWAKLVSVIVSGKVKTVRHVWAELESRFPDIAKRLKPHKELFLVSDVETYAAGVVAELRYLNANHRNLWNPHGGRNPADPFLIAVSKDQNLIVVTDEARKGPGYQKKIPHICIQRNVGCIDGASYLKGIGCIL